MIGITNAGGSGSLERATLIVTAHVGDTVTVTKDSLTESQTLTQGTTLTFVLIKFGMWTVTNPNADFSVTINIAQAGTYEVNATGNIFGIKRSLSTASTSWERTNDSENFTATASVGTIAGASSFDNMPIYSGIVRETLSTGDVMVKIPKFYFRRYVDGDNYENIEISNVQIEGFSLHPAFQHNGATQDYIYVGAYITGASGGVHYSRSNQYPASNMMRAQFRTDAANKGTGWGILDASTKSALEILILVEFADYNVQSVIGPGICGSTNTQNSGGADNVPNLTGRTAGSDGTVCPVVWRGIENLWGNIWEFVDGLNTYNTEFYVCNNQSSYQDSTTTDYTKLSYTCQYATGTAFISKLGLDTTNQAYMYPITSIAGTSSNSYIPDRVLSTVGWHAPKSCGGVGTTNDSGLFAFISYDAVSFASGDTGSRLIYIPS